LNVTQEEAGQEAISSYTDVVNGNQEQLDTASANLADLQ